MHNILKAIVNKKKKDLGRKEEKRFVKALSDRGSMAIIGELKFASPAGSNFGSANILTKKAKDYKKAGIAAISIITEKHFFKGDTSFIPQVRQVIDLPILQKDFVIDESQIYEAKFLGSDALLLIARILDKQTLKRFVLLAKQLGIEPVVEIANEEDLSKAITTTTDIIAVNARNLDTFAVNVEKACLLMKKIPQQFIRLGFSGVSSKQETLQYKKAGAKGVLIGTSLMKAENVSEFMKGLML